METSKEKVKKKVRKLKNSDNDEITETLSPKSPQSSSSHDLAHAPIDQLLLAAMQQNAQQSHKSGSKKSKKTRSQTADAVLETLKQGADLRKDIDPAEDPSILANTYDGSDSPRFDKNMTNERRRKLPPKKGVDNKGFVGDEDVVETPGKIVKKKKKQKQADTTGDMDSGPLTMQDLEDTPKKVRRKKAKSRPEDENQVEDDIDGGERLVETMMENNDGEHAVEKTDRRKKLKKGVDEDRLAENEAGNDDSANKTPKKKKKKKKRNEELADDGRVLGVTIHRTDRLKTDLYIAHPLVRIHIIDQETGAYVKKSKSDRAVTSYYENQNDKVDYILPVLTQPFDFKKRKSIIPSWEEQLIFNESYLYLVQSEEPYPKVVLFFEILDFVSMNAVAAKVVKGEGGWHRIAWAFLKVVGANGSTNTDKKVRLQLYQPPFAFKAKPGQLDVYQWWLNSLRQPYPSTLYITAKAVRTPDKVEPAVRSLFATQEEQGRITYSELKKSLTRGSKSLSKDKKPLTNWSRLPGQKCRIPNKLCLSLAGDKKGCFAIKFSPNGRFLACGCKDRDGFPVLVYEIPSGRFKCEYSGHYSLIYDIAWSSNNKDILTASSDGTARIWSLDTPSDGTAAKVFPHPAFVYSARFHPHADQLVVSGGYDCMVRVWDADSNAQMGELLQELEGHKGYVNCLCFSRDGKSLFSGDSLGVVIVWNALVLAKAATSGSPDQWSFEKVIKEKELEGVAINCLEVHPSGRRLLIHGRDNHIRMVDLRLGTVMQRYLGALCYREQVRSTLTDCGSFVVSGSEDGQAYVWNTDTGDQIALYSSLSYKYPVTAVAFHPLEHMVAFCSRGEGHPIKVYVYDIKVAQLEAGLDSRADGQEKEGEVGVAKSEASLLNLLEGKRDLKEELDASKTLRMERVKTKLATVLGNQSMTGQAATGQPNSSFAYTPGGATSMQHTMNSSWGSTFDRSMYKSQMFLPSQSSRGMMNVGGGTGWLPPRAYFPQASTPNIAMQANQGGTATFTFNPPSTQKTGTDRRSVVALYDYAAQRSDELNLQLGDRIWILHEDNANWWMGQLDNGQQGYFPSNYVTDEYLNADNHSETDEMGSSQTKSRKKVKSSDKKMTAVVTKSGQLKILSATEDSDDMEVIPVTSQRRKKNRPSSQDIAVDHNEQNTGPSKMDTPRRRRPRTKSVDQRQLASSFDGEIVSGIPPSPRKKSSKTSDHDVLSDGFSAGTSDKTSPRNPKSSKASRSRSRTVEDSLMSDRESVQRLSVSSLETGITTDTPKPRKKRSKTTEDDIGGLASRRKRSPQLSKTTSREKLLDESDRVDAVAEKRGGKRKQKTKNTESLSTE